MAVKIAKIIRGKKTRMRKKIKKLINLLRDNLILSIDEVAENIKDFIKIIKV